MQNRKSTPNLIVMLTQNDLTVYNAYDLFNECKHLGVKYWGIKEAPLSAAEIKHIFSLFHQYGKIAVLESVTYSEEEGLESAKNAAASNCDILIGTKYYDSINEICKKNKIKYMPYIGKVYNRPSILDGSSDDLIEESNKYIDKGVYGVNFLGYRHKNTSDEFIGNILQKLKTNICVAGSIDSFEKLDELIKYSPWGFTIGNAFFANKFGLGFSQQIERVYSYIDKEG